MPSPRCPSALYCSPTPVRRLELPVKSGSSAARDMSVASRDYGSRGERLRADLPVWRLRARSVMPAGTVRPT